jgi:uncharacterized protein
MAGQWELVAGPAGALAVYDVPGRTSSTPPSAVVICHGFPVARDGSAETSAGLPQLAERVASEVGWRALAGCLRGVGGSAGDFSLAGWLEDLNFLIGHAATLESGGGLWLVGFGTSGALALCAAAADGRLRGVAGLGVPATFADWGTDVAAMVGFARRVGVVRTPGFPPDENAWAAGFAALRPVDAAAAMSPRPVLLVHGLDDEEVPVSDARKLADAAGDGAELCLIPGAGHRLRADPRAMAVLVGWLERQAP